MADCYYSPMTRRPEPKPVQTGVTIHSLCVTSVPKRINKLFVWAYKRIIDGDLERTHQNTVTLQKQVNLYNIMFDKSEGA